MVSILKQNLLQKIVVFLLCATFFIQASAEQVLIDKWSLKNTFSMPESAVFDEIGKQIFVSNVNHYAKDGNGFISRISANGKNVDVQWLSGLNSPTGLATHGGLLYAADFDELLIIDISDQRVIKRVRAPHERPSLNDVAISPAGRVFVSGSASNSIYELKNGELEVWKQHDTLLKHANGLYIENGKLIFGGVKWLVFELNSKQLIENFKQPQPSIREIDGITSDGCNGYFITLIDDDRLWRVSSTGETSPVSDLAIKGIDIDNHEGKLYIPTVGGGLTVFDVEGACE